MHTPSLRIVVIGGGTGVYTVLSGLKHTPHHLTAIVSMADDGGSTGVLREEFGILPPGDVRRALVALSHAEEMLADLFAYRFEEGEGLKGHSMGNLLLTALERITGSFDRAIEEAGNILHIRGAVVPVTLENVRLEATLADGQVVRGEHAIDVPEDRSTARITGLVLKPPATAHPKALKAIKEADLVVLGPGDLYTSLLPNLLVDGIPQALRDASGKVAYVVNAVTKRGETDGFTARDFVTEVERYCGREVIDVVVINTADPTPALTERYARLEGAQVVAWSEEMFQGTSYQVVAAPLLRQESGFIRHDPKKLAAVLTSL